MLARRFGLCLAVTFAVAMFSSMTFAQQQTPVERHGQLSVKGNRIVDKNGEPVQLRGMSLFWSQWIGKYYNAEVVNWLVDDWNCNIVRAAMAVGSEGYQTKPEQEWNKVVTVVDAAIAKGIYVIVDFHTHTPETETAKEFFGKLSKKYGNVPNIIYEPYNEPLNSHNWASVIKPYHEAVIAVIRENDPDNLIVLGNQTWSQDVDKAAANPVKGENLAYVLHFYAGTHRQFLRDKAQKAMDMGFAIIVTECGTSEANGNGKLDDVEMRKWLDFMDANKISWCVWSIADKNETSAALKPGATATGKWTDEMLSATGKLIRAELRAKNMPAKQ